MMSRETDAEDNILTLNPTLSIQPDWDNVIFFRNQEIWISCKFLGRTSTHCKLQNNGKKLPTCNSEEFSVLSLSQNAIKIRHNASEQIYTFIAPQKTFNNLHKKRITSLNVSDAGMGVSVCAENNLVLWDLVSGDLLRPLDGHIANVYKCRFFPSGIVVLSAGADMQLKIWSAETGDCPVTLSGHTAAINDFCVVDKGRNIISISKDGTAKLWDCGKSACLDTIFKSSNVLNCCSIGILPDNIEPVREKPVSDREIGTNNKLLLIGSEEGFIYGVAVFSRQTIFTIAINSAVNCILRLKNQIIAGCQNGRIEIYNLQELKKPFKIYHESASPILCGCIYKESGCFVGKNDGSVIYYDCEKYSEQRISLTGSDCDPITDIACLNNKVFTGCRDGKIRQYVLGHLGSILC